MKKRRVAITGLGVVAPNGIGRNEFWHATEHGKSGVDLIMTFDTSELSSKMAAQVSDFDPLRYMSREAVRNTDRFVHFGLASARMALEDSELDLEKTDNYRVGVFIGSVFGSIPYYKEQMIAGYEKGNNGFSPFCVPRITPNDLSNQIALNFNIKGPNLSVSAACASGTNAIGRAFRLIQNSEADIIFSGGVEAPVTTNTFNAFCDLQLLSKGNGSPQTACRPFDKKRDGFVLGEGGAVLILEEMSHAMNRNARIYGEIVGYSANCGSYHMILPEPDGIEAAKVIREAIEDADVNPREIDYISATGNATQPYDKAETRSIKRVFNESAYNIPVSSIKSMIGHTIGASGAIEAVSCTLALYNNLIPPTINYQNPDPDCDLDCVPNRARRARLNAVMLNSFGLANNNACIIIKRYRHNRNVN